MSRAWNEWAAALFDVLAPALFFLLLIAAAAVGAALWYWYPAWVPRRLPRFPVRRARPRAARPATATVIEAPPPPPPDVPGQEPPVDLADRLAAEGRYAEAIRERLRAVVRDLVAAGVDVRAPGATVTEITAQAAAARPAVAAPLRAATEIFSTVWYAQRPATAAHDHEMQHLSHQVRAGLW